MMKNVLLFLSENVGLVLQQLCDLIQAEADAECNKFCDIDTENLRSEAKGYVYQEQSGDNAFPVVLHEK